MSKLGRQRKARRFVVHDAVTGEILRSGTCPAGDFERQAGSGEAVIEGVARDDTHRVDLSGAKPRLVKRRRGSSRPSLAELKDAARREICVARRHAEAGGCETSFGRVQTDVESMQRLQLLAAAARGGSLAAVEWKMADNSTARLTQSDVLQLMEQVFAHFQACHAKAQELKRAVHANTLAGIEALEIRAGWPASGGNDG